MCGIYPERSIRVQNDVELQQMATYKANRQRTPPIIMRVIFFGELYRRGAIMKIIDVMELQSIVAAVLHLMKQHSRFKVLTEHLAVHPGRQHHSTPL